MKKENVTSIPTEVVKLGEMPVNELYAPSATIDPKTGGPITVLEEIRREEEANFGGRVFTQIGEHLSDFAKAHNKGLKNGAAAGAFMIAVLAVRAKVHKP